VFVATIPLSDIGRNGGLFHSNTSNVPVKVRGHHWAALSGGQRVHSHQISRVCDEFFLGKELERAVPFRVNNVSKVAVNSHFGRRFPVEPVEPPRPDDQLTDTSARSLQQEKPAGLSRRVLSQFSRGMSYEIRD
jgi:hypothetical protein